LEWENAINIPEKALKYNSSRKATCGTDDLPGSNPSVGIIKYYELEVWIALGTLLIMK